MELNRNELAIVKKVNATVISFEKKLAKLNAKIEEIKEIEAKKLAAKLEKLEAEKLVFQETIANFEAPVMKYTEGLSTTEFLNRLKLKAEDPKEVAEISVSENIETVNYPCDKDNVEEVAEMEAIQKIEELGDFEDEEPSSLDGDAVEVIGTFDNPEFEEYPNATDTGVVFVMRSKEI